MMNNKVSFTNSNNPTISLSAVIYFPPKFDETRQYQAIVLSHPGGGVKEQTAGTYAKKLAEKGFVTIAYDASYQGESGGEPRQLENPYIRTEDISAVIDYLTTLSYVDNTRIGAMGICAGAGYTANAAIQDRRIKAIGTVSAVNIGSIFRNGWENNVKSIDALPYVEAGSNARTSDISSGEYAIMPLAPMKESDAPNEELRQANAGLAAENARLETLTAAQKEEIASLRTQLDQLLLRKSVTEVSGGVRAAKIRINRLLKEVDRCIALMNK